MDRETVDAYWWKWWRTPQTYPGPQEGDAFALFEVARDAYNATWPDDEYRSPNQRGECNEDAGLGEDHGS